MSGEIERAFLDVSEGWSTDRVIADPELNVRFTHRCHELGLTVSEESLNRLLMNLRKGGLLKDRPRAKRTTFPDLEEYRYASELAIRQLEIEKEVTLDQVICSPLLARDFDGIAARIRPGYSPLQYRWAALSLRKTRRLRPEIVNRLVQIESVHLGPVEAISLIDIPQTQGLYLFHSTRGPLYIGEATNLRKRIEKHLDHSDNKNLARWFWEHEIQELQLEIRVLPEATTTAVRRGVEAELIRSRHPSFNVQRQLRTR